MTYRRNDLRLVRLDAVAETPHLNADTKLEKHDYGSVKMFGYHTRTLTNRMWFPLVIISGRVPGIYKGQIGAFGQRCDSVGRDLRA